MKNKSFGTKLLTFVRDNTVPIMFVLICVFCIPLSGFSFSYLLNEIITRISNSIKPFHTK